MKKNQKGFHIVPVLLIFIVAGVIGFAGWRIWKNKDKQPDNTALQHSQSSPPNTTPKPATEKEVKLADGAVTLKVPVAWESGDAGCVAESSKYGRQKYLDSTILNPGEKLPTVYGDNFFGVSICVFANDLHLSAEDWFKDASKGGIGMGSPTGDDKFSTATINGYQTYYHKQINTVYHEINYALSAHNKLILVRSRLYEPGTIEGGKRVGDFRRFEPEIEKIVRSLRIK